MKQPSGDRKRSITIIEFLLIAVVVAVVSVLIALTASGIQAKHRNGERQANIDNIKARLESYFAQTETYPTPADLNNPTWRATNLPKLAKHALQDPRWNKKNSSCTKDNQAVTIPSPAVNCYSYQAVTATGLPCDNLKAICAHYTLTASLEGGEKYIKPSIN
jgi:type II secretory pathway pseudopilin PulG